MILHLPPSALNTMTPPPGGIYRISRYGVFEEPQILSRYGD